MAANETFNILSHEIWIHNAFGIGYYKSKTEVIVKQLLFFHWVCTCTLHFGLVFVCVRFYREIFRKVDN